MDEPTIGRFKATQELAEAYNDAIAQAKQMFQSMVRQANDLYDVEASTWNNREGIQNGAYRLTSQLRKSYFYAAQGLILDLPDDVGRDWFPWMVLRNRIVRSGIEPLLPVWMQHLIDQNDGVIPETWSNADVKSDAVIALEKQHGPD